MNQLIHHRFFVAVFLSLFSTTVYSQGVQLQWVKGIPGTDFVTNSKVVVDDQMNLYIKGGFSGTVDFDPGSGTANLISTNGSRFIAKYDAQGDYVFAFQLNGTIEAIVLDNSGNICITGSYDSTTDFDPGSGTATLQSVSGSYNSYIAKYDNKGNYISAFQAAYGSKRIKINTMVTDADDNLYLTGHFEGTADFNPEYGSLKLVSNGGDNDIFIAKYSRSGPLIYAFSLGDTGANDGLALAIDPNGNVYLAGLFSLTVDLDPGIGVANFTFPGLNGFVAKYSPAGNYLLGFGYNSSIYTVGLDSIGNIYLSGHLSDSMDVDPGPGEVMLFSENGNDVFIEKLDPNGNFLYANAFKSNKDYYEHGIVVDAKNSFYLYGFLMDTVYFSPGNNAGALTTEGGRDGFVTKFDASGNFMHGFSFGSTGADETTSLALDKQGDIWVAGTFNGTVDFDPGPAIVTLTSTPKAGIFFGRYTDDQTTTGIQSAQVNLQQVKVYSSSNKVVVDFTALEHVNAKVKVVNMLGQTVAEAKHTRNDMLKIELPEYAGQIYVVIIRNGSSTTAKKVWIPRN